METKAKPRYSRKWHIVRAILLGWIGGHNFWIGRNFWGMIQCFLGLTAFGAIITIPWALLDAFRDPNK